MAKEIYPLATRSLQGIRYHDNGPANSTLKPYFLLHGLGNSLDFWTAVAPSLAKQSRTVAIDIPGFGRSVPPTDGFSLPSISQTILTFLQELDTGPCILVAHSLGGSVALHLASLKPELVTRVILVDATVLTASRILQRLSRALAKPALSLNLGIQFAGGVIPLRRRTARIISSTRLGRRAAFWPFLFSPEDVDPQLLAIALSNNGGPAVFRTLCQARSVHLAELMIRVSQTVDLAWGANDRLIDYADIEEARRLLTVGRELSIKACGHWPMIETPMALSEFILATQNGAG